MANRINLNQTSFHGAGAINEIAAEVKIRGLKKALVCSDPDLIKFNVTTKVTKYLRMQDWNMNYILISNQTRRFRMYSMELRPLKKPQLIISSQSAVDLLWIHPKQSVLS